jgi:hypothetical protein
MYEIARMVEKLAEKWKNSKIQKLYNERAAFYDGH